MRMRLRPDSSLLHIIEICSKTLIKKVDFSGVDISGYIGNRNKGASVLHSPWASDHLYSHQNYWITIFIL